MFAATTRYDQSRGNDAAPADNDNDDTDKTKLQLVKKYAGLVVRKLQLRSFIPFLIIVIYSVIGAVCFLALEQQAQRDRKSDMRRELLAEYQNALKLLLSMYNKPSKLSIQEVESNFSWVLSSFQTMALEKKFSEFEWDFWNALLFSGSIYTTIGYGNIACVTLAGRIVTILYALIGIPLMLATMSQFGSLLIKIINSLSSCFKDSIKWLRSKYLKFWEKNEVVEVNGNQGVTDDLQDLTDGKVNHSIDVEADETEEVEVELDDLLRQENEAPVLGSIIATLTWILACAGIFTIWETEWSYFDSFYFFFVSLSTIGFGDMVPAHPKYMVANFLLVIIGLSMVTMCINVVQDKLENIYLQILKHMLSEYQKAMAAGKDADENMLNNWKTNKTAKFLLPLMSSEKAQKAMHKLKEEAKAQGINLPDALTNIDMETGRPAAFSPTNNTMLIPTPRVPTPVFNTVKPIQFDKTTETDPEKKPKVMPKVKLSDANCQTGGALGRTVGIQVKLIQLVDVICGSDAEKGVTKGDQTDGTLFMPPNTKSIAIQVHDVNALVNFYELSSEA